MRINISLSPSNEDRQFLDFPLDFRNHFISLLKRLLQNSETAWRFNVDKPGYSPLVFSVEFKKIINIDKAGKKILVSPPVTMKISTGIPTIMTSIVNEAMRVQGSKSVLGLKIDRILLPRPIKIRKDRALFKIRGHAVLRKKDEYINPDIHSPEEIKEAINSTLFKRSEFLAATYNFPNKIAKGIEFIPAFSKCKKGVCAHYGGMLTTIQGEIALTGPPNTLQFLYDFGLGVRTGQGFGLLEKI